MHTIRIFFHSGVVWNGSKFPVQARRHTLLYIYIYICMCIRWYVALVCCACRYRLTLALVACLYRPTSGQTRPNAPTDRPEAAAAPPRRAAPRPPYRTVLYGAQSHRRSHARNPALAHTHAPHAYAALRACACTRGLASLCCACTRRLRFALVLAHCASCLLCPISAFWCFVFCLLCPMQAYKLQKLIKKYVVIYM